MRDLRARARDECLEVARAYSTRLGIVASEETGTRDGGARSASVDSVAPDAADEDRLIVMTGHQPELYHPGVWVKVFLVQRLAEEMGICGLDLVVDTDAAGTVELVAPCLTPEVRVCRSVLAEAPPGAAYVQTPVPNERARADFRTGGVGALGTLASPALARHFSTFCDVLDESAGVVDDLGSLMTRARRAYERPAGTDYLELPVSRQARTQAMRRFSALILGDAERFRAVFNTAVAAFRRSTGTRSAAQPFPDLGRDGDRVEVPFWLLDNGVRYPVYVEGDGLFGDGREMARLGGSRDSAYEALERADLLLAPKALTLTLFQRLFVADLFVHGTGGGRYDRVTDSVIEAYFGITPPSYAVASMTLLLPLGCRITGDAEVSSLEHRLHRLTHNPDQVLAEVEFDVPAERERAEQLAAKKAALVSGIAEPDADRRAAGLAIRQVNAALAALLEPVERSVRAELDRARSARDAADVLLDRTYPYCLWDPREVMDKVR
ncbi:MAG: hypothetical protein JXP72_06795 [Coriobacteriia bacterium]|nr:hypothetical protein [Coriobacteriia bacterium]